MTNDDSGLAKISFTQTMRGYDADQVDAALRAAEQAFAAGSLVRRVRPGPGGGGAGAP